MKREAQRNRLYVTADDFDKTKQDFRLVAFFVQNDYEEGDEWKSADFLKWIRHARSLYCKRYSLQPNDPRIQEPYWKELFEQFLHDPALSKKNRGNET